ncbi:MAG TPA: hypothetical protein VJ124_19470 [Pyrinomonadaceae bacterium]|nr:hypothetical protein [Pyrinomonadaceae bacterium]
MDDRTKISAAALAPETQLSLGFRLLGLLPLLFFTAQAIHYWRIGQLGHMLWMCNMGNLLLAFGLFFEQVTLIRAAVLWMIPGLLVWLLYVVLAWGVFFSSTLAHVGGIAVSLVAVRKIGMTRSGWLYGLAWFFVMQLLSRFLTPVEFNVNVSRRIQEGWQQTFSSYWKFWLVLALLAAAIMWVLGMVLWWIWPPPSRDNIAVADR